MTRSLFRVLFCCFGGLTGFQAPMLFAQEPARASNPDASLRIVVIAGQNGVNALKTKAAALTTVEVRDAMNRPVPAAVVTFMAPDDGPGVVFSNGGRSQSLITEVNGQATITDMEPVGLGSFKLTVTAAFDQHSASAAINQVNVQNASAGASATTTNAGARTGMSSKTKLAIFGTIAVGAAVGIALALTHGKSSSSAASTIGTGAPTVGAPH